MAYLVPDDQTKLTATLFNTIAAASIVVGGITPLVTMAMRGNAAVPSYQVADLCWVVPTWLVLAVILHVYARVTLRRLRE